MLRARLAQVAEASIVAADLSAASLLTRDFLMKYLNFREQTSVP